MLGRGALANPYLAHRVAAELGIVRADPDAGMDREIDWLVHLQRLVDCTQAFTNCRPDRTIYRMKQWLRLAATFGDFKRFETIKRVRSIHELFEGLRKSA